MDVEIIRRICLARHLYELGTSGLKSDNDLYLFSAANLLQDAVEAFLLAVADFVQAGIDSNTKFDKYFILINEEIKPKELPFKNKLMRINRIRVDSKHYGIQPARDECTRLAVAVREFFEEVSSSILGVNFSTISTIDLLKDGEVKDLLCAAKFALEHDDFKECAISCRKAIFLELEIRYDISPFKDGEPLGLFGGLSRAPYYTKNKEYIDKHVGNPTDYIVYDHSHIDQELLKCKVDNTAFWNVWRLTPQVYKTKSGDWIVKHDFNKLEPVLLEDKIEYVFITTVDIILTIHINREATKFIDHHRYCLELKEEKAPVYEKADLQSQIVGTTPPGLKKLNCEFYVMGLQGDGPYWSISHFEDHLYLSGYIHNDYVK